MSGSTKRQCDQALRVPRERLRQAPRQHRRRHQVRLRLRRGLAEHVEDADAGLAARRADVRRDQLLERSKCEYTHLVLQ